MIIDCHGHYTTEPEAHHAFRKAQIEYANNRSRGKPARSSISDDEIKETIIGNQLRLQRERGADLTIFSPRCGHGASHRR